MLAEVNQEMSNLRAIVLQTRATIEYVLLKHNLGCKQLPGMCSLMCQNWWPN